MGRLRPRRAGIIGELRASARHRARAQIRAWTLQSFAAGTRHAQALQSRHDVERLLSEYPRRSTDLRCLRGRRAGNVRTGTRVAAHAALHAPMTAMHDRLALSGSATPAK